MTHIDAALMMEVDRALQTITGFWGNAAFMLYDQKKSTEEISTYLQTYALDTEQEANHAIRFISNPLDRSYIFTYFAGRDLLNELFTHGDRETYFKRLLEEPITPSQLRQWIKN
jgi:hypothetical protein